MSASNRLPVLAAEIRASHEQMLQATLTAAAKAMQAGHALIEAKSLVAHGEWLPFLKEAGVAERQAQRYMVLARSGLKPDTVTDLGGIKAALQYVSARRLPPSGQCLVAYPDIGAPHPVIVVWESEEHPGFYNLGATFCEEDARIEWMRKPIKGEPFVWIAFEKMAGNHLPQLDLITVPDMVPANIMAGLIAEASQ
ncbi:DUF3102 domain-containing protein [Mesorhizobium sophorae]|uniref:DUF3102 domain-containing protein n=1 Tax=Mesorhizobium sophorae TaxID=1300294 RepID=UPI000BA455C4|nr:DUF3102 domain-containing protein [Mesorhizobium sophorae]